MRFGVLRDEAGAVAAEFAMVIGVAVISMLAIINAGLLFYSYSNLHMATETTARWASIQATVDGETPDATAVTGKFGELYLGATGAPTSVAAEAACGIQVTSTATFSLMLGVGSTPVEMSATSCYPLG